MRALIAASLLVGCGGDDDPARPASSSTEPTDTAVGTGDTASPGPTIVQGPTLAAPPAGDIVPLARELLVATAAPSTLTLRLDDGDRVVQADFPTSQTDHRVPVLGLPAGRTIAVELELRDATGSRVVDAGDIVTTPPPQPFPDLLVRAHDPERMEPGLTVGPLNSEDATYVAAYDDRLELVWLWAGDGVFGDLRLVDGVLVGQHNRQPTTWSLLGEELARWSSDPTSGPNVVPIPYADVHHEVYPAADGSLWTLCKGSVQVDRFPIAEDQPTTFGGPTLLEDQCVAHLAADGTVLAEWWASDLLDTERIGFDSLSHTPNGADWVHLNGLVPTDDGGVVVSSRHQDAVFKVDASGQLVWILGDPTGWGPAFVPYLLSPEGDLSWTYHQHAPMFDDDGVLWLHDNHNHGRTPYTPLLEAEPEHTRLVGFRIDEQAMTVRQVAELGTDVVDGPLFNPSRGDADALPQTGHVLGTWAALPREGAGPLFQDQGLGRTGMRLIELDPTSGEAVLDLRFTGDSATARDGWTMYRAQRAPSLYPDEVVVQILP